MHEQPEPSDELLALLIRRAVSRGVPVQEAEDIVLRSYHQAAEAFDPARGSFESLYVRIVDNEVRFWWRTWQRREVRELRLVAEPRDPGLAPAAVQRADANQERLLAALDPEERRIFATWALQRHLPRGRLTAADAARGLGLSSAEWENAKRRLRTRITRLLDDWNLSPRDFFSVDDDERPQHAKRS